MRFRRVWDEAGDFALEGVYLALLVLVFLVVLSRLLNSAIAQQAANVPVVGPAVNGLRTLLGTTVNP